MLTKILKKELKLLYRWLWYLLATAVLFSAVVISLVRFALTEVDSYREKIELLATQAVQHRVYIESLDAHLVGLTPTLILKGVHVMDEDGNKEILSFNESSIGVSLIQSLRHQKFIPKAITLSGIKLALIRKKSGQIALHGFDLGNQDRAIEDNEELTGWFFSQTSLALKNSTIVWKDYKRKTKAITLTDINIELHNQGDEHRLSGSFLPGAAQGKKVEVAFDVKGDLTKPQQWQGDFFVQGDEIYLTQWGEKIKHKNTLLKDGIADFQLWGKWDAGRVAQVDGDVSVYQVKIADQQYKRQLEIGLLGGLFVYKDTADGWSLAVDRFQYTGTGGTLPETDFSIQAKNNTESVQPDIDVRVEKFSLESISEILISGSLLDKQQQELLLGLKPSGIVDTLRFHRFYNDNNKTFEYFAHAKLDEVSNQYFKQIPGVKNLSGEIWLDQNKGSLVLDSSDGNLDLGNLFRVPIKLAKVKGSLDWWKFKHGWQVNSSELQIENNEVTTLSNLSLYIPDTGSAYMDLHSSFAGSAQYKSNYLPVSIMGEGLVNWLDDSLVSGVVSNGGVVYRGRFADFPYRGPAGQFLVQFYTDNLELNYKDGWPIIKDADLDATFDSKSVSIDISLARLYSSAINNTSIKIADYKNPSVDISGKVTGGMGDVMRFVVDSPIGLSRELLDMRYSGRAITDVDIHVPLGTNDVVGYNGTVQLNKGSIGMLGGAIKITELKGKLGFSARGLDSQNLSAKIFGNKSSINIYSQTTDQGDKTYLATSGSSDAALVLKQFSLPAYKHVTGQFDWQALLDFSDAKAGVPVLNITSDLVGVDVNLPGPFTKAADTSKDLTLQAYFSGGGKSDLYANYGKNFSLGMQLAANKNSTAIEKAHLRFRSGKAKLPKNKIVYVTGSMDKFSPGVWGKHIAAYDELNKVKRKHVPVLLAMNKLDILLDADKRDKKVNVLPENFPPISGTVKQFVFDGMSLGKLDVDFKPVKTGININKLNITSADMHLSSTGNWVYKNERHNSNVKARLKSNNLGKLFKSLGLAAIINDGKANINGDINWKGTPFDFSLSKLKGNLDLHIEDGSIADVNPGAGRVVGLLSLSELPRRLMLDFSDMFKKGFVFDDIKGRFNLSGGSAYTKGISVNGAVAEVALTGRTGLVKRDYDLRVNVVPNVGDTLPVASGALFGPQIGAIVYLFEKMMGKEIEKATEREYRVSGNWENPVIKRIDIPAEKKPADSTDTDEE